MSESGFNGVMCYASRYPKMGRTEKATRKLARKIGGNCYRCKHCGMWHITKREKK